METENTEFKTEEEIKYEREREEDDKKMKKYILILNACLIVCLAWVFAYELWWKKRTTKVEPPQITNTSETNTASSS